MDPVLAGDLQQAVHGQVGIGFKITETKTSLVGSLLFLSVANTLTSVHHLSPELPQVQGDPVIGLDPYPQDLK